MKKLELTLLIGFILLCFTVSGQHWTDTVTVEDFNVRKSDPDKWTCMSKGGCYASKGEWVQYASIGYQFEIFTEKADHHGKYKVEIFDVLGVENNDWLLSDAVLIDTVDCNSPVFSKNLRTWVAKWDKQGNRAIKITAFDNKPVVIDKIKVWVDSDPWHKPIYQDSIVIVKKDSIAWNIIQKDSIAWNIIQKDSIVWDIQEIDSIIYNIEYRDTLIYQERDTIIWTPVCPPIEDCGDSTAKIPLWIIIIVGSLIITIIVLLSVKFN